MSALADIVAEIRKVAAADPDHIYQMPPDVGGLDEPACVYVHDGQPSCIIGHALWNLGLIDASLETGRGNQSGALTFLRHLGVLHDPPGRVASEEAHWIDEVQALQDVGIPWGEAVARADERGNRE